MKKRVKKCSKRNKLTEKVKVKKTIKDSVSLIVSDIKEKVIRFWKFVSERQ